MVRKLTCVWCVAFAAVVIAADPKADDERKAGLAKAAEVRGQVLAAEKAKKVDEVKARHAEFVTALQGVAAHFTEFTPEEATKPKTFQKLTINADGKKVDAFRFKTPAGKANWDLTWEFVYPKDGGLTSWGIIAREGTVDGFKTFATKTNFAEKGADLPKENKQVSQKLTGGKLKPEAEYLIWFAFTGDKPADVHVRMGLTLAK